MPTRTLAALSFLAALAAAGAAGGDGPPPTFTAHTAGGPPRAGRLERLGDGWSAVLAGADPVRVEAGELLSLRRADRVLPPPPPDPHAVLANGDRLPGD